MSADVVAARPEPVTVRRWEPFALAGILVLAALLYVWALGSEGWGNAFYAAAVRSMSENLTNFLFGSYDPAGVVTVDKPPMAFWPQVLAAAVFGYHGWALLLPQAVEGVAAVFLLHRAVRWWAGEHVALLAAAILALTPVTVAINRDNNPDTLLMLFCVAAGYALTRSVQPGQRARAGTLWLAQAAFWVGCGFVTKMLAAWMIVPALGLAYLCGSRATWPRRIADLAVATAVLLASSLWWVALTAWWPAPKPYVGGSTDGGAWDLVVGYNGFGRLFGEHLGGRGAGGGHAHGAAPRGFGGMHDAGGLSRMFGDQVGGQVSWLLPLCLFVLVVVAVSGWRRRSTGFGVDGWVLWGAWLVVLCAVFSAQQGIFHPYYTTQVAPAIAALAAAGLAVLWRYYRAPGAAWVLLPLAVASSAAWAVVLVERDPAWNGWLAYAVAGLAAVAVVVLVAVRYTGRSAARTGAVLGLVALLLAPATWSAATSLRPTGPGLTHGAMATAGPPSSPFGRGRRMPDVPGMPNPRQLSDILRTGRLPGGATLNGTSLSGTQRRILDYARHNAPAARITLAVEGGAMRSTAYIIDSDATVIGMGGFSGGDNAPDIAQLSAWAAGRQLGFVLLPTGNGLGRIMGGAAAATRSAWVRTHCSLVPPAAYGAPAATPAADFTAQALYRCLPDARR